MEKNRFVQGIESINAGHIVTYDVFCFDRVLAVIYNGDVDESLVYRILDTRYDEWNHVDENPDVEPFCCEEWMLMGLDELGIDYTPIYVE